MTNVLETPEANAAPGPSAAARSVVERQALAGEVGETLRFSGVRDFDDDGLLQVTAAVEVLGRRVYAVRVAAAGEVAEGALSELTPARSRRRRAVAPRRKSSNGSRSCRATRRGDGCGWAGSCAPAAPWAAVFPARRHPWGCEHPLTPQCCRFTAVSTGSTGVAATSVGEVIGARSSVGYSMGAVRCGEGAATGAAATAGDRTLRAGAATPRSGWGSLALHATAGGSAPRRPRRWLPRAATPRHPAPRK